MSYPGERKYRQCLWCDRPVHVWNHLLKQRNRGKFCSYLCFAETRRAFSDALADGRLETVLAPERALAKARRLAAFSASAGYAEMERRYRRHLPPC